MSYKLTIEKKEDILWVTATGTRTVQTILAMSKDILAACIEKKVKKVLIDVRAMEGHLSVLEAFDISDIHFPKMRNPNEITHNAIVDLKEYKESYRFFETVAINRGFRLRIFLEPGLAKDWLKK